MLNARTKTSTIDASSDAVAFLIIIGIVMSLSCYRPLFGIKEILFERKEEKYKKLVRKWTGGI
jgi:hypothetical protein